MIVMATDAMIVFPIWALVRESSSRITAISGATPNHAKKHRKKANHDMWKARICGVFKLNRSMRVAFVDVAMRLRCCSSRRGPTPRACVCVCDE